MKPSAHVQDIRTPSSAAALLPDELGGQIRLHGLDTQRHSCRLYFSYAWLVFILLAAARRLWRAFPAIGAELNSDARWTYLPNAHKLLEAPWAFLTTDPASYHVAPLGYIWTALWGADPVYTQLANCALFLVSLVLLWRCATRLGGIWAGVVATGLMVIHPDLHTHIPQVLTESIFLFGLMLMLTGGVEYVLGARHRRVWLVLASLGLTITLLSRPVLQLLTIVALTLGLIVSATMASRQQAIRSGKQLMFRLMSRQICLALAAALVLPAAVVLKNGHYFGVWGLGTGAGTGLFYGVSPFKMGLEPVYSNFRYDAGASAGAAAPEVQGNPLHQRADQINALAAIDIVRNTSISDNLVFFAHKLRAWLFYSTPELQVSYRLRTIRLFEWFSIGAATIALLWHWRRGGAVPLTGPRNKVLRRLGTLSVLLVLPIAMALQLAPVLYNTRYNTYFIEPWLMLLSGVAVSILLQRPAPASRALVYTDRMPTLKEVQLGVLRWASVCLLLALSVALARHAQRHEIWRMDPYRPGPTQTLLGSSHFGNLQSQQATLLDSAQWQLNSNPATLWLPLHPLDATAMHPSRILDALWRIRLAIAPTQHASSSCRQATIQVTASYPSAQPWFVPKPAIQLQLNGSMTTYALHGNDALRPAGRGLLGVTFFCPPGTLVTWEGAELRRLTLPEAVHALIHHGTAIDPYLRTEPPAPSP